jgi:hypothetical protein
MNKTWVKMTRPETACIQKTAQKPETPYRGLPNQALSFFMNDKSLL